jgi:hypothetical protein
MFIYLYIFYDNTPCQARRFSYRYGRPCASGLRSRAIAGPGPGLRYLFIGSVDVSSGISMLEVLQILFNGAEVKKLSENLPNGVDVKVDVEKINPQAPDAVMLDFTYTINYKPSVASVVISGQAFCRDTPENVKKLLADFKKKKELPVEFGAAAINMINANAGMNSIFLIRPFNLLPPFMPPIMVVEPAAKKKG